ncbi:MAG: hypothetical protein MUF84_12630 [Anaerolineae bacterium]|nr:hypothetical protein [Anaerolineae bacterium]
MNIHLAALGWIPDAPAGNRLRWHYPADVVDGDAYLGRGGTPSGTFTRQASCRGGTTFPGRRRRFASSIKGATRGWWPWTATETSWRTRW